MTAAQVEDGDLVARMLAAAPAAREFCDASAELAAVGGEPADKSGARRKMIPRTRSTSTTEPTSNP